MSQRWCAEKPGRPGPRSSLAAAASAVESAAQSRSVCWVSVAREQQTTQNRTGDGPQSGSEFAYDVVNCMTQR